MMGVVGAREGGWPGGVGDHGAGNTQKGTWRVGVWERDPQNVMRHASRLPAPVHPIIESSWADTAQNAALAS